MVTAANQRTAAADKSLKEAKMAVDVLSGEVTALKAMVGVTGEGAIVGTMMLPLMVLWGVCCGWCNEELHHSCHDSVTSGMFWWLVGDMSHMDVVQRGAMEVCREEGGVEGNLIIMS